MSALAGLRVLVTRARSQASDLTDRIEALGATPLVLPSIEFEAVSGTSAERLDCALARADSFDRIVLTSARGVEAVCTRLESLGNTTKAKVSSRYLVAVGKVTASALESRLRLPDLVPSQFSAHGILSSLGPIWGLRFLLLRGDLARPDLPMGLRARGAQVEDVVAYRSIKSAEPSSLAEDWACPDVLTFTSSSGVENTVARLKEIGKEGWLRQVPNVCIGPVTAETLTSLGFPVAVIAKQATMESLVEAIIELALAHKNDLHREELSGI